MQRVWSITLAHCTGVDGSIIRSDLLCHDIRKHELEESESLYLIDRTAFFFPQLNPTEERCYVFETVLFECARRTGGRMFVWSTTVGDDLFVARKLGIPRSHFVEG